MSRLILDYDDLCINNGNVGGLEISVPGFKGSPTDLENSPTQIYIEIYEGKLNVHVWGSNNSEDPITVIIDPETTN